MARYSVARSSAAEEDLIHIWLYVSEHNPEAADNLLDSIDRRTRILADHPYAGTARDEIRAGIRQLVEGNYLIFYRVTDSQVEIVRVLHSRQRITAGSF